MDPLAYSAEIARKIYLLFDTKYIQTKRNIFEEIENMKDNELWSSNYKEGSQNRKTTREFIIYQLSH
jgi:hypothetical protein